MLHLQCTTLGDTGKKFILMVLYSFFLPKLFEVELHNNSWAHQTTSLNRLFSLHIGSLSLCIQQWKIIERINESGRNSLHHSSLQSSIAHSQPFQKRTFCFYDSLPSTWAICILYASFGQQCGSYNTASNDQLFPGHTNGLNYAF